MIQWGRVKWQSTSQGGNSLPRSAAQRSHARNRHNGIEALAWRNVIEYSRQCDDY